MMRHHGVVSSAVMILTALSVSHTAFAAGFEKAVPFSGRYGGIVGAGASVAEGPEALFFNPAALTENDSPELTEKRARFSINFSPTPSRFEGALSNGSMPLSTDPKVSPMFAGFASYALTRDLAIGLGVYTAGGNNADYDGIEVSPVFENVELASKLAITEASVGIGYQLVEGLDVGAAFRFADVRGEFSSFSFEREGYALSQIRYSGLTDTQKGYRAGIRYAPKDAGFGFGASYRSALDFNARGKLSGRVQALAGPLASSCASSPCVFESSSGGLSSSFPMQVNLGGFYDVSNSLRAVVEYSFTGYGKNQRISATGKLLFPDGTEAIDMGDRPIELGWSHQQQGKLGIIYSGLRNWTLRSGYSLVGQVTPSSKASPTFAPPGLAHVVAVGVGAHLGSMMADVAYEYTRATGQGVAPTEGEFIAEAHALHAGVSLGF